MNKETFYNSLKYFGYTALLMFTGPGILYSAFKNQGHPWFWPVFGLGILICLLAIGMGFYSLKLILKGLFDQDKDSEMKKK